MIELDRWDTFNVNVSKIEFWNIFPREPFRFKFDGGLEEFDEIDVTDITNEYYCSDELFNVDINKHRRTAKSER